MIIAKKEYSQKNSDIVIFTLEDGTKASGFVTKAHKPTGLDDLKVGDNIEPEIVVNGNYKNIVGFKKLEPKAEPKAPFEPAPISGPEHGMALKLVGDLFIAGKLPDNSPLVVKMFAELHRILGTTR